MCNNGIWVICIDIRNEKTSLLQLINKACDLADFRNVQCGAVCIGEIDEEMKRCFAENGANYILLADYRGSEETELAEILRQMIKRYEPEMIMFPGNHIGKYLASVLSAAFDAALTADCIDISLSEEGEYIFSRAALSDSVIANIQAINTNIRMCTVNQNSFPNKNYQINKDYQIIKFDYTTPVSGNIPMLLQSIEKSNLGDNADWVNAKIVFAVGRGVTSEKYLNYIKKIAQMYNAVVVGTRAAVEAGMIEEKRQVGQSGCSICPDIYVGFGVSGACQHIVGIKNAKLIIAVNKDDKAAIFDYADYKIVNNIESFIENWVKLSDYN